MTTSASEIGVGPIEDIPAGEGRVYAVGGDQVAVFRLRDGSLRAVSARCPHRGGPIADGQIDDDVVLCPLHVHAFDLATGECRTADLRLRTYAVRVDGGQVLVSPAATDLTPLPKDSR